MTNSFSSLVQVTTVDGLLLQGYYSQDSQDTAVLFIHGFTGNFYENYFTHIISNNLRAHSISFLTGNTRGCEKIKDLELTNGKIKTIGARYELLEESPLDIDAWIQFLLDMGHSKIILMGHSLGTMKAVRYLHEGKHAKNIAKLVLLAPFDKNRLLEDYIKKPLQDLLVQAKQKVKEGLGEEIITPDFDNTNVSYQTFLSWYSQDDLGKMWDFSHPEYDFPILNGIKVPTKVIVGSNNEYFYPSDPQNPEIAMELIKKHITTCETKIINSADHCYRGHEEELANEILDFITI